MPIGHNFHAGYALNNNPSAPIVANAPYPLPCLYVHGVRVELRHCYTAESADAGRRACADGMDFVEVVPYCDTGVSGVSGAGSALAALLEDVSAGKVRLVVVTDLSRLGRTQE